MEPGLIEQGEIYSKQCCESHGKGVRKSAPKKAKYHVGVAVKNRKNLVFVRPTVAILNFTRP